VRFHPFPNGPAASPDYPTGHAQSTQLNSQYSDPLFLVSRCVNRLSSLNLIQPSANLDNPYSLQYGLTIDQRLTNELSLSVAYVGTQGRHLLQVTTPDAPVVNLLSINSVTAMPNASMSYFPVFTACSSVVGQSTSATTGCIANSGTSTTLRPDTNVQLTRTLLQSTADSGYNSLQLQLRSRPHWNLQFGSAFTWSHSIDNASDFFDTANGPALAQDSFNSSERASSDFDARHRLALYFLWTTPDAAPRVFRNVQLSGVFAAQTGQPFTVTSAIDINQDGNLSDRLNTTYLDAANHLSTSSDRRIPLVLTGNPLSLLSATEQALAAQGLPTSSAGDCFNPNTEVNQCDGAVGRNTFRAPSNNNLDLAVSRRFKLPSVDGRYVQVRVETFNLLNRAQFGIPVRILEAPGFGASVNTTAPNRIVQVAMRVVF